MKLAVLIAAATLTLSVAATAAGPKSFTAAFTAATHTPKINVHWPYSVKIADLQGKLLAGRITVAIVDPLGTVHPVQFGANKTNVTNWPFKGTFRDWVIWPPESAVGVALKFRCTVKTAKGIAVLTYLVTPKR